jgi:conjugal transfer pilus assembly protein TraE
MKLLTFVRSWRDLVAKSAVLVFSNAVLAVAVIVLAVIALNKKPVITMTPPNLTAEAQVGAKSANATYLMSWGMYFATMTGNVTPKNVVFVADSIGAIMDPAIYPEVRRQLFALAADPIFSERGGSVTFEVQNVSYDAPSNKVFAVGEQVSNSTTGKQKRSRYVYELVIEVRNYQPVITSVDHYQGAARTAKWMREEERRKRRHAKGQEADELQASPWIDEASRYDAPTSAVRDNRFESAVEGEQN